MAAPVAVYMVVVERVAAAGWEVAEVKAPMGWAAVVAQEMGPMAEMTARARVGAVGAKVARMVEAAVVAAVAVGRLTSIAHHSQCSQCPFHKHRSWKYPLHRHSSHPMRTRGCQCTLQCTVGRRAALMAAAMGSTTWAEASAGWDAGAVAVAHMVARALAVTCTPRTHRNRRNLGT